MESSARRQADHWDQWAQVFPDLYRDRDPDTAVQFLRSACNGPNALELGAGSGRICVPLAATGLAVTAVEVSPRLCERIAEQRNNLDLAVVQADMAAYRGGPFSLIYAVHSTFFHLTSQDEQVACLANAANQLTSGGSIVLSCFIPSAEILGGRHHLELSGLGPSSIDIRATEIDTALQLITYREVNLSSEGTRVLPVEQRWAWPSEIDLMARLAGLRLQERYGGFDRRPFDATCSSHVSVFAPVD